MRPFLEVAYVDYIVGAGERVRAALLGGIDGLRKDEQVQFIADMAVMRDVVTFGGTTQYAWYDNKQNFLEYTDALSIEDMDERVKEGCLPLGIYGNGPLGDGFTPGEGLPDDWGQQLALAIDDILGGLDEQKQMEVPSGRGGDTVPAAGPLIYGIIVAGIAGTVIGSVVAWRALDPDYRRHAASVSEAAAAYIARLKIFKDTGKMPPPSAIEIGAKAAIEKTAGAGGKSAWMWTGAIAGGVTVATLAGGLIWRYASKGRAPDKRSIGA